MSRLLAKFGAAAAITQEVPSGTIDGSNTVFTITNLPASTLSLLVMQNGLAVSPSEYTLSNQTITFSVAPQVGQSLLAYYIKQ